MKRRVRDFRKEYADRVRRGLAKGYSRARARGHARAGDVPRVKPSIPDPSDPHERALKLMKAGATQKAADQLIVSLRSYVIRKPKPDGKGYVKPWRGERTAPQAWVLVFDC